MRRRRVLLRQHPIRMKLCKLPLRCNFPANRPANPSYTQQMAETRAPHLPPIPIHHQRPCQPQAFRCARSHALTLRTGARSSTPSTPLRSNSASLSRTHRIVKPESTRLRSSMRGQRGTRRPILEQGLRVCESWVAVGTFPTPKLCGLELDPLRCGKTNVSSDRRTKSTARGPLKE
jgi:hypothetical protein